MNRIFLPLIGMSLAVSAMADPLTLADALASARANRAALAAAESQLQAAVLARRGAGSLPTTRLSVGFTSDVEVGGSDEDLVLTQPFDFFGRGSAERMAADADVMRARAEYAQVWADIQQSVIEEFTEAAAAQARQRSAVESAAIAGQLFDAIKVLVDEGRLPGVQLTRVGIERDRSVLVQLQRKGEFETRLRRLSGATGIPVGDIEIGGFPNLEMGEGTAMARPDLLILAADVKAAEADVQVIGAVFRPEFEVQARRTAWQEPETRYGLRLQLTIPLFTHGRERAEVAAAKSRLASARQRLDDAERIAAVEVEAARGELESAREQKAQYEAVKRAADKLVESSRAGFTERAVTLIELLEATRALREVEEGMIDAELRLVQAQAAYVRAAGLAMEGGK